MLVTICKVGLILAVIVIGLGTGHGSVANFGSSAISTAGGPVAAFFAALVAALWAYDGWNNVSMVASEIRDPQRNLPRALIGGTIAVIAIYLLANAAYFYVLPAPEVAASDLVAADMMRKIFGQTGAGLVSVAAMISIFAALNGSILTGSRVPYAMALDGLFFKPVAKVHPAYRTPGISILALSAWSAILVLSGQIRSAFHLCDLRQLDSLRHDDRCRFSAASQASRHAPALSHLRISRGADCFCDERPRPGDFYAV